MDGKTKACSQLSVAKPGGRLSPIFMTPGLCPIAHIHHHSQARLLSHASGAYEKLWMYWLDSGKCHSCIFFQDCSRLPNPTMEAPVNLTQVACPKVMDLLPDVGIWTLLDTRLPLYRTSPKPAALSGGCSEKIYADEKSQPPNSFFKEAKQIW